MTYPNGPQQGPQQHNTASYGGNVFANQGKKMTVRQDNRTIIHARMRTFTGWAALVMLAADVAFFVYGASAYTGNEGSSADLVRAVTYLVMLAVTISLVRRWFRQRL